MTSTAHQVVDEMVREFEALKAPADRALMARITRFFFDAVKGLTAEDKTAALQAPDDILAVIETVARRPAEESPKYLAKLRGAIQKQKMLEAEGGVIGPAKVGKLLGISRQAVGQRRAARKLLGVPAAGGYVYPVWQFKDGSTLDGLEAVLAALSAHDPWMTLVFFLKHDTALNEKRPVDVLRRGRISQVVRAAQMYLEHGAA